MKPLIKFIVPGDPVGKGRPRFARSGHCYTPKETVEYEELVRRCYNCTSDTALPVSDKPIRMIIEAEYKIPVSISKKRRLLMLDRKELPCKKPDIDNIAKIVMDALNGLAYFDDRQVVELWIKKYSGINPHVSVELEEVLEERK